MIFIFSDYLRHNLPSPIVVYPDDHSTSIKSIFTSMISYDLKSLDHGTSFEQKIIKNAVFIIFVVHSARAQVRARQFVFKFEFS